MQKDENFYLQAREISWAQNQSMSLRQIHASKNPITNDNLHYSFILCTQDV